MNRHLACTVIAAAIVAPLGSAAQEANRGFYWQLANCLDETNKHDICKAFRNGIRYATALGTDPADVMTASVVVPLDQYANWNAEANIAQLEAKMATVSIRPNPEAPSSIIHDLARLGTARADGTYALDIASYGALTEPMLDAIATETLAIPLTNDGNAMAAARAITDAVESLPADLQPASRVEPGMPDAIAVIPFPQEADFGAPAPGAAIP